MPLKSKWKFRLNIALATLFLGVTASEVVLAADNATPPPIFMPPKRVVVPKLAGAITVDGDLSEGVWAKAVTLGPFIQNNGSEQERERTQVRLWYDDAALYLGWVCTDSDVQATFTARDSKFWEEEVAEFFLTPTNLSLYFELQWNPLGGVFDAIITNQLDAAGVSKKFDGDWSFTAREMTSAVKLKGTANNSDDKDESWTVEVRLPFSDLQHPAPKPNEVWRGNFYRYNRTKNLPADLVTWSPTLLPGFHQPSRFGYLEFGQ